MGIIQKKAIAYSIVSYLGVLIGSISTIFIYPRNEQIYGLFRFLTDTANIFVPFATLGGSYVAIRLFTKFEDKPAQHHGFLGVLIGLLFIGTLLCFAIYWVAFDAMFEDPNLKDKAIFDKYIFLICPLFFFMGLFAILKTYSNNFFQIVVPNLLEQSIKISFPVVFILYISRLIPLDGLVAFILLHYIIINIVILYYLKSLGELSLKIDWIYLRNKALQRNLINFALFGIAGSGGAMLALRIDSFMVAKLTGNLSDTGSFNISSLIASNVLIPLTAIYAVATPIVTKAWAENNLSEINKVYQKSTEILLIAGLLLFGCVALCIDDLFALMPRQNPSEAAKLVVYIVGIKCVFDMATGINDAIISYSPSYKFALYLLPLTLVLNIIGNIMFIPKYGIAGAAMATLLTSMVFNICKFIFLYLKFQLNPYTYKNFITLILSISLFILVYQLQIQWHPVINIGIKGGLYTIAFVGILLWFDLSDDLKLYFDKGWMLVLNFFVRKK
jgi:O-antigen/teichoic acid export membrane protein